MVDIEAIASNLTKDSTGVWLARNQPEISYPPEGNETCFAVEDTSFWFQHRNDVISHLVGNLSPDATFFDVGGGNGCVSNALQLAGIDVVLVEPGPHGARAAMQRGISTVIQSTLEDAGFASGVLPSVGLFDVLEHIESDANFLRTIHSLLRPNGRVYITVPAYNFLWSVDDVQAGHYRRYTTRTLTERLENSGFEINYCSYLFSFLVPPIFLLRSIPSQIGFRKSVSEETTKKEHCSGGGITAALMQKCLDWELNRVQMRKPIPVGSSCIAVATKKA